MDEVIVNKPESDESYERKKYFDWAHGKMINPDPTRPKCSVCFRRSPDLVLKSDGHRDYLLCESHTEAV